MTQPHNAVATTVPVGYYPYGVAVTPDGTKVYVANFLSNTTSVIDTANNTVTATVAVGPYPSGVAVTPGWNEGICGGLKRNCLCN